MNPVSTRAGGADGCAAITGAVTGAAKSIAGIVGSNDGGTASEPMLGTKGLKSPPDSGINIPRDLP